MKMTDFVRKPFGLGAKNNVLRVLRKIESFVMKILYPNITGKWIANKITDSNPTVSGALFNSKGSTNIPSGGAWGANVGIGFDASLSSSIYTKNVVQPLSLIVSSVVRF